MAEPTLPSVETTPRRRRRRRHRGFGPADFLRPPQPVAAVAQGLPPAPPEPWTEESVKDFARARKRREYQLAPLIELSLPELQEMAESEGVENALGMPRGALLRRLIQRRAGVSGVFFATGVVDVLPDGHAFLRHGANDYTPNLETDVLLHPALVQRHNLKQGQEITGVLAPASGDQGILVLHEVLSVFGEEPARQLSLAPFTERVPLYPDRRLVLETEPELIETRIMDLIAPIGKGQRGLIVAPPRTGKTVLLQMIANAVVQNHPECHLIILLVDERPEEVTDFDRTVKGEREIVASTFDEPPSRHIKVAEMVTERAKRLVEQGRDVVILLDSITRLARSYNNEAPANSKILTGGIVAEALQKPKRFFGAARNIEGGGSLTILATALIETNSKMDEVIFEEFKGTGNLELVLDRKLADRRIWPAIDINRSGTRKEDLLFTKEELQRVWLLRKVLNDMNPVEAMELLIERMRKSDDNADFLLNLSVQ